MFHDGLWGIDMVGFTGGGGGWVRLGASRFWNACRIRFKFKYNDVGKSVDVILIEECNFGCFGD